MSMLEIAYIIWRPESRGKGYMAEAVRLFIDYLFDLHNIQRIQLTLMPANQASRRVAEKCGFKSEGILRQSFFQKGRFVDLELFSLLRDERPNSQVLSE
jgi:ribosomal-protein-alanine N-acetyltransferase